MERVSVDEGRGSAVLGVAAESVICMSGSTVDVEVTAGV